MPPGAVSRDLVGFRAFGRHGELGVVIAVTGDARSSSQVVVVRGGVSEGVTYYVPAGRARTFSVEDRAVRLEIDLTEFVPRLRKDGMVELRASS